MKKFLAFAAIIFLFAFTSVNFDSKKATAIVNQYQGMYVYTDCKPSGEYEYLGTVKPKGAGWGSGQYTDIRDRLIKAAKKQFPNSDGLVLDLKDGGVDKADVIRLK